MRSKKLGSKTRPRLNFSNIAKGLQIPEDAENQR